MTRNYDASKQAKKCGREYWTSHDPHFSTSFLIMCRKITSHWQPLFSKKMEVAVSFSYKIGGGGIIFDFPTKLAAAASFSYKIGGGGNDLATLLAAVLTWFGYWLKHRYSLIK